jgi:serine/threonine protein phosphatase PrpC
LSSRASESVTPPRHQPGAGRRRVRLARGPVTIGEPAPTVEVRFGDAEPYRPDTLADGGTALGLTVRAASVRGLAKRYAGGPRQDDVCLRLHDPSRTLIAAVADGVSEAPRSHLGAALAVRYATAALARQLDAGEVDSLDWTAVFDQAAWSLVEEQRRSGASPDAGVDEAARSLATTLLVAAIVAGEGEARVQVAAVGDSPCLLLRRREYDAIVGAPDSRDGLIGGGVQSLPLGARAVETGSCTLEPGSVLLLCTDGLALPLGDGRGEVGRVLARELASPPDVVDFARLLDFSRSTYDDDRSLVAVWGPGPS